MKRLLLAGVVVVAAAVPLAQSAQAAPPAPPVPGTIAIGDGHKPFLIGYATGVQIYVCQSIPGGHRWGFVAPRANLYDDNGKLLATHYGGPTWEARDGSTAVGRRDAGVTVGGLAPALADCNADTTGARTEVPYTADYVFFKATGA
jgi:hypothetical protein